MKKITLKYYGYRDPDSQLMQAANLLATKMKTRTLKIDRRNKSASINVADPYLAAAYADAIRKKTGCSVVVANLPETVTAFFRFLKERNILEEWCERTVKHREEPITNFMRYKNRRGWTINCFYWEDTPDAKKWETTDDQWIEHISTNNL